jgi:hypothetical protein
MHNVPCTFGKLVSEVKVDLFYRYCSSCYGSVLWNLNHPDIMRIVMLDVMPLRRIWNLPYSTYSNLVIALRCRLPLTDELCRRVIIFQAKCMNSAYEVIKHVCLHTIYEFRSSSERGRNLSHVSAGSARQCCKGHVSFLRESLFSTLRRNQIP